MSHDGLEGGLGKICQEGSTQKKHKQKTRGKMKLCGSYCCLIRLCSVDGRDPAKPPIGCI